jgi:hypothetical protein
MDFVDGAGEGVRVVKRKSKICAQSILEHLRKYPYTPLTNVVNTLQWLNDDRFVLINESHKKFQDAISAMNRIIYLKDIKEMYIYLREYSPLFECLNLNEYNNFYMSVEETYNDIMNLLLFKNNILLTEKFIDIFIMFKYKQWKEKNCIEVIGPPSSYKTTFFNAVCCALLTKGDIHRINRHCQFAFHSVPTKRVVLQDDASIESCELETMLKLYSGAQVETNVKYKVHIPNNKVPIIILNNRSMLKNEERWNTRMYRYQWSACNTNKILQKKWNPMDLYHMFIVYNCFTIK